MLSEIEETRGHWAAAGDLIQKAAMLDPASLPVAGAEQAERLLDPKHPANQMIDRRRL